MNKTIKENNQLHKDLICAKEEIQTLQLQLDRANLNKDPDGTELVVRKMREKE